MIKPNLTESWQNKIDLFSLENEKIVYAELVDNSIYWIHNLTQKKELVFLNKEYAVYHCYEHGFYIVYLINQGGEDFVNLTINDLKRLSEKNYVHYVLNSSSVSNRYLQIYENQNIFKNFDYSLIMICSEILTENNPFDVARLKKMKYFFSCTNMASEGRSGICQWAIDNSDKLKIDYKYSLTYYYHKFGFCYYQKGKQELDISNRKNKVFLYSKHSGEHTERYSLIKQALETDRICEKPYTSDDWFWYFVNYNYYHMPFFTDYNSCKFNLIMETQPPSLIRNDANQFVSEKTLKGLMVSTPTYVALQYPVYQNLKNAGFYFLNEEFGEYDEKTYQQNYNNFCNWLKNCSDEEFNDMFEKSYTKSLNNKVVLENWFNSDKTNEINLLINK